MSDHLKLLALDAEDLAVISAHVQDAVLRVGDIVFDETSGRLVLGINRFAWEVRPARRIFGKQHERRRSMLHFDRITKLRSTGIDRKEEDTILSVLAVTFEADNQVEPGGTLTIVFSGEAAMQAEVECIEVRMSDQGGAWAASGRPRHGIR